MAREVKETKREIGPESSRDPRGWVGYCGGARGKDGRVRASLGTRAGCLGWTGSRELVGGEGR